MTKEELMIIAGMVHDIGESEKHHITMDYSSSLGFVTLYVHKKDGKGYSDGIEDSIDIMSLDAEAKAFLSRWTETLRKERVLNGTH